MSSETSGPRCRRAPSASIYFTCIHTVFLPSRLGTATQVANVARCDSSRMSAPARGEGTSIGRVAVGRGVDRAAVAACGFHEYTLVGPLQPAANVAASSISAHRHPAVRPVGMRVRSIMVNNRRSRCSTSNAQRPNRAERRVTGTVPRPPLPMQTRESRSCADGWCAAGCRVSAGRCPRRRRSSRSTPRPCRPPAR